MARKIKFPLEMDEGVQVRTIEELRQNFDLEKVISYFIDGKLLTWLNDRYYEVEASEISQLSKEDKDIKKKLCDILGVEYNEEDEISVDEIQYRKERLFKLKQFTDDEEIINNIDSVAFDQEELAELLDEDLKIIYLCEGEFSIPLSKENVKYLGIGNSVAIINSKKNVNLDIKKISLQNIKVKALNKISIIQNDNEKGGNYYKKNLFCLNNRDLIKSDIDEKNKKIVATDVFKFCENSEYVFYVSINNKFKVHRIRINADEDKRLNFNISGEIGTGVLNEKDNSLQCSNDFLIWREESALYKADLDGNFKTRIVSDISYSDNFYVVDNYIFYITCGRGTKVVCKYELNHDTKIEIDSSVDNLVMGDTELFYVRTSEYKECCIIKTNLDGNNKEVIKEFGVIGKRWVYDLRYNNKILYYKRHLDDNKEYSIIIN